MTGQARRRAAPGVRPAVAEDVPRPARRRRHDARRRSSRPGRSSFPTFWPKGQRFYAPLSGIAPGEVALLEIAPVPGAPVRLSTGVMVLYADDESFTFMTPEGHTLSAWITFSAERDGDVTVAQAQALERPSDPFDELAYMLGGNRQNNKFWRGDAARTSRASSASRTPVVDVAGRLHRQEPPVAPRPQRPQQRHDPVGAPDPDGAGPQADRPGVRLPTS